MDSTAPTREDPSSATVDPNRPEERPRGTDPRPKTADSDTHNAATVPPATTTTTAAPAAGQKTVPVAGPPPAAGSPASSTHKFAASNTANQQPPHQEHDSPPKVIQPTFFGQIAGTDGQPYETLRKRITKAYRRHTLQYWFVATLSNGLLFIQIAIAAALTVLGAFNSVAARRATIGLGATNTVVAGLITYFKSRNQPNRARQFRNDLAKIVDQLDDAEANFRNSEYPGQGTEYKVLEDIRKQYREARNDAQANYPDLWVKGATVPKNPPEGPPSGAPSERKTATAADTPPLERTSRQAPLVSAGGSSLPAKQPVAR